MRRAAILVAGLLGGVFARGQTPVCDLFKDLEASDGRRLIVTGELVISKDISVLGAPDCDNRYISSHVRWPAGLRLRPSASVAPDQLRRFQAAAEEADRLRKAGKIVAATGSFAGRFSVGPSGSLPAELAFDSIEDLTVEALPDARELPVIPICDLFQNLTQWKGKRIAVRAESIGTDEGNWIVGRCEGAFVTNGYRWPVSLAYAGPAYYSAETAPLVDAREPSNPPKGEEEFRGRFNVVRTETYVGRLRMRDQTTAVCRAGGDWLTLGFGHQGGAAAELVVDTVTDIELAHEPPLNLDDTEEEPCQPPNLAELCSKASTLRAAASTGCVAEASAILSAKGIDSKGGSESPALSSAIANGHKAMVELLLQHGAPVNPAVFDLWPPLWEAAHSGRIPILKMLLKAGADVDGRDETGATLLADYGCFDTRVARVLLEAGANPNAVDRDGQSALSQASEYGYEDAITLLIEHGANVNLKDNRGRTALMHAAAGKYVDAIPILLAHGADLHARDAEGKTALDIAQSSKNQVAVEMLTAAMAGKK